MALASGEEFEGRDALGRAALTHAVEQGNRSVVELLRATGADVDVRAANGATALNMSAREGRSEIVRPLMRAGANFTCDGHRATLLRLGPLMRAGASFARS